jgi:large conductance mechanosensitive channel
MPEKDKTESSQTHVVHTTDGDIKITHPDTKKHSHVTVLFESDEIVKEQLGGFVNFLRERGVVGVAVGFIIGLQAQTLMKQMVESFVTPLLDFWFNGLAKKQITLQAGGKPVYLSWGEFLYSLITFLFVVLFVYLIVKLLRLDKLDKPKDKK